MLFGFVAGVVGVGLSKGGFTTVNLPFIVRVGGLAGLYVFRAPSAKDFCLPVGLCGGANAIVGPGLCKKSVIVVLSMEGGGCWDPRTLPGEQEMWNGWFCFARFGCFWVEVGVREF